MQHFSYAFALLFSIFGLLILDFRFKLVLGTNWRRGLKTIGAALVAYIIWDLTLIIFGVVRNGNSDFTLPFTLLPELPLEEILFLILLSYCTLLIYTEAQRWRRTR